MFDRRDKPYKILQDVDGMYGDFFLKIWKVRSQMYPGIFNLKTIVGKNRFPLQEVTIHSTSIYIMSTCLNNLYAGITKVYRNTYGPYLNGVYYSLVSKPSRDGC